MIRSTQKTTLSGVDELIEMFEDFEDIAYREFVEVVDDVEPQMLAELRTDAPPVKYPIDWTSERQKRAFFATDGFGRGIPTQRTGNVQAGWKVLTERVGGIFSVVVENAVDYAKRVYGSLAKGGQRFQQRFHRNTGWQNANETVDYWLDVIDDEYRERMKRIAETASKRRAFTR